MISSILFLLSNNSIGIKAKNYTFISHPLAIVDAYEFKYIYGIRKA